ncbi:hypothetical protein LO767_18615 [Halopseudomonas aestusnigri]|jgi:hypothetical protein|uniref:hypothetical protein n=1 Tax=Halopseudomonas TaxID=2901189 RepID=UPI001E458E02|nr:MULTISPECIES: hypothetical protein [Halopseudomonas]UGV30931.1 hypothetical protein LO767_18615 [Halopseudomonas aestusnigri]BDX19662.1 hypothetical protein MFKK_24720 [Halopseudomonas aestusnigri]
MKPTDPGEFIASLNAGVLANQMGMALSHVAAGVVEHGKKGKVTLTLELSQIGDSHQVKVAHKLDFTEPTKRGSKREDTATETPFFVTANGLQLFADNPSGQLFSKQDAPVVARD